MDMKCDACKTKHEIRGVCSACLILHRVNKECYLDVHKKHIIDMKRDSYSQPRWTVLDIENDKKLYPEDEKLKQYYVEVLSGDIQ